ncbi:hypothetical protein BKA81DRAFT_366477 [Phyllosticta paracitricarpa]
MGMVRSGRTCEARELAGRKLQRQTDGRQEQEKDERLSRIVGDLESGEPGQSPKSRRLARVRQPRVRSLLDSLNCPSGGEPGPEATLVRTTTACPKSKYPASSPLLHQRPFRFRLLVYPLLIRISTSALATGKLLCQSSANVAMTSSIRASNSIQHRLDPWKCNSAG